MGKTLNVKTETTTPAELNLFVTLVLDMVQKKTVRGANGLWHGPDLDECTDDALNVCDNANGDCQNNTGSFTCSCNSGWETPIGNDEFSDQTADIVCEDEDECAGDGDGHNCAADGNIGCVNSDGSFDCVCVDGAVEIYADGVTPVEPEMRSCRDYNECDGDNDVATHNYDAVSTSCTNVVRYELADPDASDEFWKSEYSNLCSISMFQILRCRM